MAKITINLPNVSDESISRIVDVLSTPLIRAGVESKEASGQGVVFRDENGHEYHTGLPDALKFSGLLDEVEELESKRSDLYSELEDIRGEMLRVSDEINELNRVSGDLNIEQAELKDIIASLSRQRDELVTENRELRAEKSELLVWKDGKAELLGELDLLKRDRDELEDKITELRAEKDETERFVGWGVEEPEKRLEDIVDAMIEAEADAGVNELAEQEQAEGKIARQINSFNDFMAWSEGKGYKHGPFPADPCGYKAGAKKREE